MFKKSPEIIISGVTCLLAGAVAPVWAQSRIDAWPAGSASTAGFLLLLPLGLIFFLLSSLPQAEKEAPRAATTAFWVWATAVVAYFLVGFAFQFGGLAVSNSHPDFAELYWNWSPLDASFGPGWGMIGLRGWALSGPAATPGVYDLFLRHVAMVGVITTAPVFLLYGRVKGWLLPVLGVLVGAVLYPLAGNWVWSAGWLANLGLNRQLGHGFVDAGLGTPFLLAGTVTLLALLILKPVKSSSDPARPEEFIPTPMPAAYLPMLSFLGLGLILWSWAFAAGGQHIPTAVNFAMPRAALNGFLAVFAGFLAAGLYSRFTTADFNPLMSARGGLAGLVLVSAAAPFIPPWQAILAGLVAGIALPPAIYWLDHRLALADYTAGAIIFGAMGLLGCLLVGFLADGANGIGWNGRPLGVAGLLVAPGLSANWPGQFNAQLLGAGAIIMWAGLTSGALFGIYRRLTANRSAVTADKEQMTADLTVDS